MTPAPVSSCSCTQETDPAPSNCADQDRSSPEILVADSRITAANRLDHFLARWAVNRGGHRIMPGLYRLGNPGPDSPVFASANYTLSFDALRSALAGVDAYILVLDTKGINVWCAAGKGTFSTDELVRQIGTAGLAGIVRNRRIIVPQLGAPGISWPDVLRRTGFTVEYGPVRARDLPEYLRSHTATPAMRRVEFPLRDRAVLAPVELVHVLLPALVAAIMFWFLAGLSAALAVVAAVIAGTILFPILLPFIPTHDFSTKGFILGGIVALPFAVLYGTDPHLAGWLAIACAIIPLLIIPAVTAYLALNFTGSTPFTSRTGVKKEIFRYVPVMAFMAGAGVLLGILLGAGRLLGAI
ncbi:mercury methylation corrinoid protein HgcA [Methanoregula sp.]|uniref:mercury methylation corrinoid protein HgcA n=1 Tax=Methanoregula sp. TaxID=2052170 RepID=UPI003C7912C7